MMGDSEEGPSRHDIWLALAELFFLNTEHPDYFYESTARLLRDAGWNRERVMRDMEQLIAPIAGANLGYLVYPVIGKWAGFDKEWLCEKIERREQRRQKKPHWYFYLQDRHARWMLKKLKIERLLDLL